MRHSINLQVDTLHQPKTTELTFVFEIRESFHAEIQLFYQTTVCVLFNISEVYIFILIKKKMQ